MDITEIILADHEAQRREFARLDDVDRSDTATMGALWQGLAEMMEVHAKAEEKFFYPRLLQLGHESNDASEVDETKDAIGDHNDIRAGIRKAAASQVGSADWWAGIRAARKANDEHMGEEEHEGLADVRRHVTLEERHAIAVAFLGWQAVHRHGVQPVDEDPERYLQDHD